MRSPNNHSWIVGRLFDFFYPNPIGYVLKLGLLDANEAAFFNLDCLAVPHNRVRPFPRLL